MQVVYALKISSNICYGEVCVADLTFFKSSAFIATAFLFYYFLLFLVIKKCRYEANDYVFLIKEIDSECFG